MPKGLHATLNLAIAPRLIAAFGSYFRVCVVFELVDELKN
jgi:hypothetical protein